MIVCTCTCVTTSQGCVTTHIERLTLLDTMHAASANPRTRTRTHQQFSWTIEQTRTRTLDLVTNHQSAREWHGMRCDYSLFGRTQSLACKCDINGAYDCFRDEDSMYMRREVLIMHEYLVEVSRSSRLEYTMSMRENGRSCRPQEISRELLYETELAWYASSRSGQSYRGEKAYMLD